MMGWPQITFLVLIAIGLIGTGFKLGSKRDWSDLGEAARELMFVALAYFGGFFG